jgi:alanyl-tRNA synthetase
LKAGEVAEEYLRERENILSEVAKKLKVKEEGVLSAVKKLFEAWKELGKVKK